MSPPAHPAGGRAVAGSNPVSPITRKARKRGRFDFSCGAARGPTGNKRGKSSAGWGQFSSVVALADVKRSHGAGHLYVKHGSYYGRWRGVDGRLVNKKIGKVRQRGESDGITRADAERGLRRLVEAEISAAATRCSSSARAASRASAGPVRSP
jgi:hypothetical protein